MQRTKEKHQAANGKSLAFSSQGFTIRSERQQQTAIAKHNPPFRRRREHDNDHQTHAHHHKHNNKHGAMHEKKTNDNKKSSGDADKVGGVGDIGDDDWRC